MNAHGACLGSSRYKGQSGILNSNGHFYHTGSRLGGAGEGAGQGRGRGEGR